MFNFRGYPSTTGQRHVGYVRFLKPKNPDTPLKDIDCEVDCDCPDFKYRFAWSNKQRGAAKVGPGSYNKAFNRAPRITNPTNQPGLCVAEGALVSTARGLMPIEDITALDQVWTTKGWRQVLTAGRTGTKPVVKVELRSGNVLEVTAEHPVLTFDERRGFQWTEAGKLTESDFLCCTLPGDLPVQEKGTLEIEHYAGDKLIYSGGKVNLDETFAELVGYMVSEGAPGLFCNTDQRVLDDFAQKWKTVFGDGSVIVRTEEACYIGVHGTRILESMGFRFGCYQKLVPAWILRGNRAIIVAFLRGAYAGDGNFCGRHSTYASVSEGLARKIHLLLGTVGVRPSIGLYAQGVNDSPTWLVRTASGEETRKLFDLLKPIRGYSTQPNSDGERAHHSYVFTNPRPLFKDVIERNLIQIENDDLVPLQDACHSGMRDRVASQLLAHGKLSKQRFRVGGKPHNVAKRSDIEDALRPYRVSLLLEQLNLPKAKGFGIHAHDVNHALSVLKRELPDAYEELRLLEELTFDQVSVVRNPTAAVNVYDLTVEDAEQFTVSGIVVHNCKHLIAVKDYLGDLVYKMPHSLKAPERLGRLVTLTNRSVINPPKGGEAEPVITKPAPFRASPNQQSSPGLSRGRVEPKISALAASKRAEREREQAVNRQRRSGPDTTELPPELPNPEMIGAHAGRGNAVRPGRITRRHTLNPLPPPLPKPVGKPKMLGANPARGNAVHPGPIRRTKGESLEAVVSNMNKIYEEAVAALDGAEALSTGDAGQGQPGMLDLLKEIRDLLQQVVGGDGGVPAGEDDGFKLPDNASEVDLTTGEPEDEPEALDELPLPTDGKDLTNNDGRVDLGAEDREGAEGDDDDEDRR